jgi:hypothetical protein
MTEQSAPIRIVDPTVGPKAEVPQAQGHTRATEPVTMPVELKINGSTNSRSTRAPRCSMRCASTCYLPARRKAATTASAVHAPCTSMGDA